MGRGWSSAGVQELLERTGSDACRPDGLSEEYGFRDGLYYLSEEQAQAILDLRLNRLTALEQGKLIDPDRAEQTVFARAKAERDAHIAWVQRSAPIMASELGVETGPVFAVLDRLMREHLEHLSTTPLGGLFHADGE